MGVRKHSFMIVHHFSINRPTDDGTKMEAPGVLVNAALDYAVTHVCHFLRVRSDLI